MTARKARSRHALAGTYRRDRHGRFTAATAGTRPAGGLPPPKRLTARAAAAWEDIAAAAAALQVLSVSDAPALELAACALAEFRHLDELVVHQGVTYTTETKTGSTMHRVRPEAQLRADAWRRATALLLRFGLTPADRGRVELATPAGRAIAASSQRPAAGDPSRTYFEEDDRSAAWLAEYAPPGMSA